MNVLVPVLVDLGLGGGAIAFFARTIVVFKEKGVWRR